MKSIQRTAILFLVGVGLSACGGGGSGSSGDSSGTSSPSPTNQSPGGIWTVQYVEASGPNAGDQIDGKALITETGDVFFAGIDTVNGCAEIGFGTVGVNGSAVSGSTNDAVVTFSQNPFVNTTCTYSDGSTSAASALSGTVAQRSSLTLTVNTTTSMGTALGAETQTWSYSNLYAETPSLATVAGNYADGSDTLTVSSNGAIFEQDPATGCVINGQASIVNPSYNAYAFSFTFSSCTGNYAALNGQAATGLGYYDDSVNPPQLVYGEHVTVNGQTIVAAGALNQM
jgi:hypothetical protein